VTFEYSDEPDSALDQIGDLAPCMVIVGMDLGEMEGLEFVALMMNRYKSYEGKVLVLPNKDDPFPPVVQQRNTKTGKSTTDQIEGGQVVEVVRETALGVAAGAAAAEAVPTPIPVEGAVTEPSPSAPPAPPPAEASAPPATANAGLPLPAEEPEALPAPPSRPGASPPGLGPLPPVGAEPGLAPMPAAAPQPGGRPAWMLPAGLVAVLAIAAVAYLLMRGGGASDKKAPEPQTASAKTAGTAGTAGHPGDETGGDEATGDEATGDETGGDEATGDETGGDEATGDETGGDEAAGDHAKPGQATHPELRKYATLPLEFARGGSDFKVTDDGALEETVARFAEVLKEDPAVWLEIGGHTSIDGAPEANYDLGKRRANKVRRLLAKHGIPKARTIVKNYGAAMPIASNNDTEGRKQNRRVTLRLVD